MENIIRTGSVYRVYSKLKKENLLGNYFDLEKLPNVRVLDPGILKYIKNKYELEWQDISDFLNVRVGAVMRWISKKRAIRLSRLLVLADKFKIGKEDLFRRINNALFSFGNHHGNNRIRLELNFEKFELAKYLVPQSNKTTYLKKDASPHIKDYILTNFSIDKYYYRKTGLININSFLLSNFLKTFYEYKKDLILNFPLAALTTDWIDKNVDLIKAVILPCLLSDGGAKPKNNVFISGESDIIHRLWSDAFYYGYELLPSSYKLKVKNKQTYVTTHRLTDKLKKEFIELTPGFKKSPYTQTKEDYLRGPQPTIRALFSASNLEQQIALRVWMIAEGSSTVRLDKRSGLIYPVIQLACAHPLLISELKKLFEMHGVHMIIGREKVGWSGVKKLFSGAFSSTINFLGIGGFIRGVLINSQSNYYTGLDKQDVLLSRFEYAYRQRENLVKRDADTVEINNRIRKIAIDKSFKDEQFYIKYFGDKK